MPGQGFRGRLNGTQTDNMIKIAARAPAENARRIVGAGQQVIGFQAPGNQALSAFGIRIDSSMVIVEGRILAPPQLTYGENSTSATRDGTWNMLGKTFAKPEKVTKWSFLKLGNAQLPPDQLKGFQSQLKAYGLGDEPPRVPRGFTQSLPGGEDSDDKAIEEIFGVISKTGINILLVVLPTKSAITYARVKFWADVKTGIHTVCVLSDKLRERVVLQYWANVALKFNLKSGGVNQVLSRKLGFLDSGDTMLVGIDVTHPAPNSMPETPSIAGVVASCDPTYGQYPGSIRCQDSRLEIVKYLEDMLGERLRLWMKKNGNRCPKNLLIYRDGRQFEQLNLLTFG